MPLTSDEIAHQQELLRIHRRTIADLVKQASHYKGEDFTPTATVSGLEEARKAMARIKQILHTERLQVEGKLNDEPSSSNGPPSPPSQESLNSTTEPATKVPSPKQLTIDIVLLYSCGGSRAIVTGQATA